MQPTYLNSTNVRVLRSVLVLIQSIFGQFAFLEINTELNKQDHNRFQGRDGTIP